MVRALLVLLGLSALLDVALGAWASVAWGAFATAWFPGASSMAGDDPRLLGLVLAFLLFFVAAAQGLAFWWIKKERPEGFALAITFGLYLVVSSLATFVVFRRTEFLLVDGLRGALLAATAFFGMNEPSTVRRLRLPDPSSEGDRGSRRDERHERQERGGRYRHDGRSDNRSDGRREGRREKPGEHAKGAKGSRGPNVAVARPEKARPAAPNVQAVRPRPVESARPRLAEAVADPNRSLAVVVKGEFKTRPLDEVGAGTDSSEGRSPRRTRRPRAGSGGTSEVSASSAPASVGSGSGPAASAESAGSFDRGGDEDSRGERGGRNRRRRGGRDRSRGGSAEARAPESSTLGSSASGSSTFDRVEPRPAAPEGGARGAGELFGLTREVASYETNPEREVGISSGEDLYGRTKRTERPRRGPAPESRDATSGAPIGPVPDSEVRSQRSAEEARAPRGESDSPE